MTHTHHEKRVQKRTRRSDAIAWRLNKSDELRSAWLLESSTDGLAFAWRGARAPATDALIELRLTPDSDHEELVVARVRRVAKVHDDLMVIAAELWRTTPFPPAAATAEAKPEGAVAPCLELAMFGANAAAAARDLFRRATLWRPGE